MFHYWLLQVDLNQTCFKFSWFVQQMEIKHSTHLISSRYYPWYCAWQWDRVSSSFPPGTPVQAWHLHWACWLNWCIAVPVMSLLFPLGNVHLSSEGGGWVENGGSTKKIVEVWGGGGVYENYFTPIGGSTKKKNVTISKVVDHFHVTTSIIWGVYENSGSHEGVYVNFALEKGGLWKISEFIAISTHPPPANIKWIFP